MQRSDFIYQQPVAFHCQNKEQARAIKASIEKYGALPGELSVRVLGALSKHQHTLQQVGQATKGNKAALVTHLPKLMAFVKDITG